jgi:hypothetical protein
LTIWRGDGSILVRQHPVRSGAFLDEAIRPLRIIVAGHRRAPARERAYLVINYSPGGITPASDIIISRSSVSSEEGDL